MNAQKRLDELDNFKPTSEQINALPEGIRTYIGDIETNADYAGIIAQNILTKDQNAMLVAANAELKAEIERMKTENHIKHGGWKCAFCGFDGQDNTQVQVFCTCCRKHK